MIYKCPDCGGPVMYDPESNQMKCTQCGNIVNKQFSYEAEQESTAQNEAAGEPHAMSPQERAKAASQVLQQKKIRYGRPGEEQNEFGSTDDGQQQAGYENTQYMEMHVYKCTSCGAQLMINGNETSTFCSFCGQPTVVFDRVSKELQPDYILPFKITETQAVALIKERFKKGLYVPDEIKNPKIDKLRGIYIPFWLYTSYIRMQANINTQTGSGKHKRTIHSYRDGDCTYSRVTLDASRKLNDELSQRLEPYQMKEIQPFRPEFLSGFYADRYDVEAAEVSGQAQLRCESYLGDTLIKTCEGSGGRIVNKSVSYKVQGIEYALLPAWFMTFWYDNELYTILVNGQTGKVVGNVPIEKKKVAIGFVITAILSCLLGIFLASAAQGTEDGFKLLIAISAMVLAVGIARWQRYNKDRAKFKAGNTLQYVKGRQDKTWVQ